MSPIKRAVSYIVSWLCTLSVCFFIHRKMCWNYFLTNNSLSIHLVLVLCCAVSPAVVWHVRCCRRLNMLLVQIKWIRYNMLISEMAGFYFEMFGTLTHLMSWYSVLLNTFTAQFISSSDLSLWNINLNLMLTDRYRYWFVFVSTVDSVGELCAW